MPEQTPESGGPAMAGPADENLRVRTFTQDDVDRIVTERLRRERQRVEKAVRDEFAERLAELEAAGEAAQQSRQDAETLAAALKAAENRALIAERLLAKGAGLPYPYAALVKGEDVESIDASIEAAREQWAADLRQYAHPARNVGAPVPPNPGGPARTTRVDAELAERMRRGEAEAFREYHAIRR